ncbi:MAG: hypothetical protein OXU45_00540, partial [Candidatus Melainabacteria bacterium]|nr:hypothetical protein [Candidatus Melainabacteria bacterium]
ETEFHGDGSYEHYFFNDVANSNDGYDGLIQYRVEAHTPLYKLGGHDGRLVTRMQGFGYLDDDIGDFLDDPLIELPEIFVQDDFKVFGHDSSFVAGKFAVRRFFAKNEIVADPFDIGESSYFGSPANSLKPLNFLNMMRADGDLSPDPVISPNVFTGSYGFMYSIKDNDGDKFWTDGWGFKQALLTNKVENLGDNFFSVTELNKNWGKKYPGYSATGVVFGQGDVLPQPGKALGDPGGVIMLYSSLVQRIKRADLYYHLTKFYQTSATQEEFSTIFFNIGGYYNFKNSDRAGFHGLWWQNQFNRRSPICFIADYVHNFSDNVFGSLYSIYYYDFPNPTLDTYESDNSFSFGGALTYHF